MNAHESGHTPKRKTFWTLIIEGKKFEWLEQRLLANN